MPDERMKDLRYSYIDLGEDELPQAHQNLELYLEIVQRIYERVMTDPTSAVLLNELLSRENEPS